MIACQRIDAYASAWTRRVLVADLLLAAGAGGAAFRLAHSLAAGMAIPLALAAGGIVLLVLRLRGRTADVALVARHLDRQLPALEESTALLLAEPAGLSSIARLQQGRIEARFRDITLPQLPGAPLVRAISVVLALLAGSAVLARALPVTAKRPIAVAHAPGTRSPFSLQLLERRVEPPAYTGLGARRDTGWAGEVEEGARVTWRVRGEPTADAAWLVGAGGDTVRFASAGDQTDTLGLTATRGAALRFEATRGTDTARSPWSLLAVRRDVPPTATLTQPQPRTVRQYTDPDTVGVSLLAADDYGIARVALVLTVARGKGEGVQFRERRIHLERGTSSGPQNNRYATVLAPRALGLAPGDELYLHAEVRDARTPSPNVTRTETVVIALADTGSAPLADLRGILPPTAPEYFRSQRQIILDTERLLKERRSLSTEQFQFQSSGIGFDQGVLRVRYGELVGDESVDEADAAHTEAADPTTKSGEALRAALDEKPVDTSSAPAAELHRHDDEENATRLARSVKATLKSALEEMWQAERLLRTYQPEKALPAEYRALEYLKRVQQASRVYVQRVGFDPPPIDEANLRLSGVLTGVGSRSRAREATLGDSAPATRRALTLLSRQTAGVVDQSTRVALEAAGRELAARAVEGPGPAFEALGPLRALLDAPGAANDAQVSAARMALWRAVPPRQQPPSRADGPVSPLARRYSQLAEPGR